MATPGVTFRDLSNDELQTLYREAAREVAEWGAYVERGREDGVTAPNPPNEVEMAQEVMDACAAEYTARGLRYRKDVGQ